MPKLKDMINSSKNELFLKSAIETHSNADARRAPSEQKRMGTTRGTTCFVHVFSVIVFVRFLFLFASSGRTLRKYYLIFGVEKSSQAKTSIGMS